MAKKIGLYFGDWKGLVVGSAFENYETVVFISGNFGEVDSSGDWYSTDEGLILIQEFDNLLNENVLQYAESLGMIQVDSSWIFTDVKNAEKFFEWLKEKTVNSGYELVEE